VLIATMAARIACQWVRSNQSTTTQSLPSVYAAAVEQFELGGQYLDTLIRLVMRELGLNAARS
jgi:hypothetical protein